MGASTAATLADDGERMREIMGLAGTRALGAGKTLASQGRMLVEKTASKLQDAGLNAGAQAEPMRSVGPAEQFSYLDAANLPQGPISRAQLEELFQAGKIDSDTNVLKTGGTGWVRYGALDS